MYSFLTSDIINRRVYARVDHQYDITDYGWSGNGEKVVNRFGQTFNELLRLASEDLNTFNGFSFHFNFSGLGRIEEIQHISFEYVRLGSKNLNGVTDNVKVFNNWEEDAEKYKQYKGVTPVTYPLFNPRTAIEQTIRGGSGQVLYWTPHMFSYPLATFDAIRDAVQTDSEIQTWALKNIQNGFLGTTLIKAPSGFDSDEDKTKFLYKLKELQGSYNANSIIAVDWPEEFTGSFIESIPAPNNDNLFNSTGEKVTNTILQNFSVPGPLLAVNPQGSVFTQEQIRDSYIYMNLRTSNKRKLLERIFQPIGKLMGVRLGEIVEKPWEIIGQNDPELNGDPNQLQENASTNEAITPEADKENKKAQANLRGSVGGVQGVLQVQQSVAAGLTAYDAGVLILVEIYGFTKEVAKGLLGTKKQLLEAPATKQQSNVVKKEQKEATPEEEEDTEETAFHKIAALWQNK
jgi:hypothetical protein